ncbi:MAG: folA, partial [Lacunisphaera sp.]|nr:folA [Lacunisphaera sp.]
MPKPLNLIVACAENRVIGRDGRLPFDIPEDKAWFHAKTAGTVVVLGRICFETWPKVLADGRQPVVITSQPERIARLSSQ